MNMTKCIQILTDICYIKYCYYNDYLDCKTS